MKNFKKYINYALLSLSLLLFASCGPNSKKSEQLLDKGVEYYYHAQYTKAVKLFKNSIDEDDQNFEAWFWMGNYYENFGQHNKALEAFNKTIELNPNFADAFANRAKVKKNRGDKKGACADWRKADKLGKPNLTDNLNWCERNGF